MVNKKTVTLIFFIFLVGCQGRVNVIPQDIPTQKTTDLNSMATTTSIAVFDIRPDIQKKCITFSSTTYDKSIDGKIVFLDNWGQSVILFGGNELRFPNDFKGNNGNSEQSVSPDGTLLMFRKVTYEPAQSYIVLVNSDGQVVHDFIDEQRWVSGIAWLSNEYIRYPISSAEDKEQLLLYAMNAETGEMHELRTDLPDIADNGSPNWGIDAWAIYFGFKKGINIVYDPSLTHVAYPKIRATYPFYPAVLYDVQNNKELSLANLDYSVDPKWSPDGRYFSMIGEETANPNQDIYIANRDRNQFIPLTNLAKFYPNVNFGSYSWSPDSNEIAFWAHLEDTQVEVNDSSLFLYNIATMKMTDLCIKGFGSDSPLGIKTSHDLRGQPIWSPDGKKLVITQYDANTQEVVVILIDIEKQLAYSIATDLEPIGWMK